MAATGGVYLLINQARSKPVGARPKDHAVKKSSSALSARKTIYSLALLVAIGAINPPVFAELPMYVDDADTLDVNGMKIEAVLSRDQKERGSEFVFGLSPIKSVEIGVSFVRATSRDPDLSTQLRGTGITIKWVPIQNDTGWSLGGSFDHGLTRVHKPSFDPADPENRERDTEKELSLAGLATYRLESGQVFHFNLSNKRTRTYKGGGRVGTWGVGYEFPLMKNLQLTVETFGEERRGPDKSIGVRYAIAESLKISGAVGRGNNRSFGLIGVAWEF